MLLVYHYNLPLCGLDVLRSFFFTIASGAPEAGRDQTNGDDKEYHYSLLCRYTRYYFSDVT